MRRLNQASLGILLLLSACSRDLIDESEPIHIYWLDSLEKRLERKQDGESIPIDQAGDFYCVRPSDLEKILKRTK